MINIVNLARKAVETIGPQRRKAMGTTPFDAAGHGRRGYGWNPTSLGLNTLLYSDGLELVQRNRDAVRNNCWASAAIDSYVANAIGRGIRPITQHPDPAVAEQLTKKWNRWTKQCDLEYEADNPSSGQSDFYGLQTLIAREVMEAGECFVKFIPRSPKEGLVVPIQLQILESEQLPIWRMFSDGVPDDNRVRFGIEYRPDNRRAAYHFWKQHPGETMFFPEGSLSIMRVPAKDCLHVYKQVRAGQMRGMPWMTSVLAKLYSMDKYTDSEMFRKEVSSMITGFIKQVLPGDPILTADSHVAQPADPSAQIAKLEPGSFPVLNPGEEIQFADAVDSGDYVSFIRAGLQAFASGCGLAEYQVSGDLSKISYSSIRAGVLEFRRKCEAFQHGVFIHQVCHPVYLRWLREAMLNMVFGVKAMNAYMDDPEPFEEVRWVTPGFPWVDPDKEIKAFERAVRDGFTSRAYVCSQQGVDVGDVDAQQEADNKRADEKKLSYDSDGRKVLSGKNAGLTEEDIQESVSSGQSQVED